MPHLYPRHKQDQPITLLSWGPRSLSKLGLQAPAPESRTQYGARTSSTKKTLTVGPERAGTHDKRATSLPSTHTQVCARDNRSVTCLDGLCNDRSLTDTGRESSVTKPCPASTATQLLTPTNTQTISLPNHHFFFPPFIFSK